MRPAELHAGEPDFRADSHVVGRSGPYRLVGSDAIEIGGSDHAVTFRYTITDGTTLRLTPVMPSCAPGCFDAQWAVAVSYLGLPWTRIGP